MQRQLHGEKGRAMVADYGPKSNHDMGEPPFSRNGTHTHSATLNTDACQDSEEYRTMKAGLNAWERWEKLDTQGKLEVILTRDKEGGTPCRALK